MSRLFILHTFIWNTGVFESCFLITPPKVRCVMDITPMSNGDYMDSERKEEWSRVVVGLVQQVQLASHMFLLVFFVAIQVSKCLL